MTRRPWRRPWSRRRRSGRRLSLSLLIPPVLVLAAAGGVALFAPGPGAGGARDVVLERGGGVLGVGETLRRAGVVRSAWLFAVVAEVTGAGSRLKAGEYAFAPHESLISVIEAIARGQVVRRFVTIPEGLTSADAAAILDRADGLVGTAPTAPEGALLPETDEVRRGETRADVIDRMRRARDQLLARLWASRPAGLPYANPEQAVTLASVVEKETALPAERPRVAAVYVNRLRLGMRLDSDPTVIYGLTHGRPLGHGLTRSELDDASPYNTYRFGGLPPTPIDNPGRASLIAALAPARSADLYFVADGSGGHAFAATLSDHVRNVLRWRKVERSRSGDP